jgi:nicotinate-nucleotide adenylyltransferase
MDFLLKRPPRPGSRLGILAGSFHPITRAHLALARAALRDLDEVLLVMPREFPHKAYEGVGLQDRIEMVRLAAAGHEGLSVALTDGGLFIDIARECREHYGYECEMWFLCGRDAAERIVNWDYGAEGRFAEQLNEFGLLVAERQGRYEAPQEYCGRIRPLALDGDWNEVSATEIRERIKAGRAWEHLVPEAIVAQVGRLYGG